MSSHFYPLQNSLSSFCTGQLSQLPVLKNTKSKVCFLSEHFSLCLLLVLLSLVKLLHQISSLADEETLKANFSSCWSISLFVFSYLLAKFFHQIWRVWRRNTKHFPFYQSISLFLCLSCLQVKFCNQMSRGWWRNTMHFCLCLSPVASKVLSPNVKRLMLCTSKCITDATVQTRIPS